MAIFRRAFKCDARIDRIKGACHDMSMTWRTQSLFFLALAWLSACASVATRLPDISLPELAAERASQETSAFAEIDRLHARLWDVAYPVLAENTDLCPRTRPDIGIATYSLKSYPKDMREAAAREFGAQDEPSIRRVIKGSAADKAGLKAGDILLSEDSKPMTATGKSMRAQLKNGAAKINVRRGETQFFVNVTPREICDYKVTLSMRSTINAYATSRSIVMTSGMMNFTQSDEELALIVAHELAHNTMAHVRKIVGNMIISGFATRYTRPFESEADYVGLYYLVRAGYNPEGTEKLWQRMALIGPRSVGRAKTHPTHPDRYLRLAAAREEIAAKQAAGEPLVPNYKKSDS